MSGDSIGVLANRYGSRFLPANHVFGIRRVIHLGLMASVAYQSLPTPGAARAVERIGPWWVVASVLNVAWALRGIGVRHAELPVIATAVGWLVPAGLGAGADAYAGALVRARGFGAVGNDLMP